MHPISTASARRGSALLLSLFLTLLGSLVFGLAADASAVMWERAKLQNILESASEAVKLERQRRPLATRRELEFAARAAAAHNRIRHGEDGARVDFDGSSVIAACEANIYFLRLVHPRPIALSASVPVSP